MGRSIKRSSPGRFHSRAVYRNEDLRLHFLICTTKIAVRPGIESEKHLAIYGVEDIK